MLSLLVACGDTNCAAQESKRRLLDRRPSMSLHFDFLLLPLSLPINHVPFIPCITRKVEGKSRAKTQIRSSMGVVQGDKFVCVGPWTSEAKDEARR
jgi:hypothetical protein